MRSIERTPLPFPDDSVEHLYSSHTFEHLGYWVGLLREIVRVCKHDGPVEIWTPYGPSRDAIAMRHVYFVNEIHGRHICFEHVRHYLGDSNRYLLWEESRHN